MKEAFSKIFVKFQYTTLLYLYSKENTHQNKTKLAYFISTKCINI